MLHYCNKSCIQLLIQVIFQPFLVLIFLPMILVFSISMIRCHQKPLLSARATTYINSLVRKNYFSKTLKNWNHPFQTSRYIVSLASDRLGRSTSAQSPSNSFSILSQIPRNEQNFVSKWQREGEHYIKWSTLEALNTQLSSIEEKTFRTNKEKKQLFTDLATVYFARFHNIIREEYQVSVTKQYLFVTYYLVPTC